MVGQSLESNEDRRVVHPVKTCEQAPMRAVCFPAIFIAPGAPISLVNFEDAFQFDGRG
jgi:hypothetical protein